MCAREKCARKAVQTLIPQNQAVKSHVIIPFFLCMSSLLVVPYLKGFINTNVYSVRGESRTSPESLKSILKDIQHTGVAYRMMPDTVNQISGVWHIFCKMIHEANETYFRGFAFFEHVKKPLYYGNHGDLMMESSSISRESKFEITGCSNDAPIVTYQVSPDSLRPTYFSANVTGSCESITLTSIDKNRFVQFDSSLQTVSLWRDTQIMLRKGIYQIVSPPFGISNVHLSILISRFVRHHARLGFSGVVIYVRYGHNIFSDLPDHMLEEYNELIHSGQLIFFMWKYFSVPTDEKRSRYFDQAIVYNHAILSFMDSPVRLMIVDLDEYLFLNDTGSESFMNQVFALSEHVMVPRYNYILDLERCSDLCLMNQSDGEILIWERLNADTTLKHYNYRQSMVDMYKSIIHPPQVWGYAVHEGIPITGLPYHQTESDRRFLSQHYISHFANLFDLRIKMENMVFDPVMKDF